MGNHDNIRENPQVPLEKYPQSQEEAKMLGQPWDEEPEEPYQINIAKAREDPQSRVFVKALFQMKTIYDKVEVLQRKLQNTKNTVYASIGI